MGTNAVQSPVERSPWDSTSLVSAQEHAALQAERDALQRQLNALLARSHAGDHAVRQQGEHGCLVESIEDAEQAGYERGYDVGFEKGMEAGREAVQEEVEEVCIIKIAHFDLPCLKHPRSQRSCEAGQ